MNDAERQALADHRREQAEIERLELAELEDKRLAEREREYQTMRQAERRAQEEAQLSAEERRLAENRKLLPEVTSVEQFKNLPLVERSKYYSAFGADFMLELQAREKTGLSQQEWDRLRKAKPVLSETEQELRGRVGGDGKRRP